MKAVYSERYGPPGILEVREVDRPSVGDDQVLVRVRAASLHPDVWHAVTGLPYALRLFGFGLFRPKFNIPGTDMAGVVDSVGKNVTRFSPGDAVFGETVAFTEWGNGGAFAEYVAVNQELLALKPGDVSFEQAAAVPTAGYILLMNLRDKRDIGPDKRVLINGAGGGVGMLALQYAKAHGAHVTAVDSTGKLEMLRSLGADEIIDYTRDDFTELGVIYDFIFDIPAKHPFSAIRRVLHEDGRYVIIGHDQFGASGKRVLGLLTHFLRLVFLSRFAKQLRGPEIPMPERSEAIVVLRELLESGKLTPVIDSTYPLDGIREAFRHMVEDELLGKVIITP